jgi:hypothetical protein
MPPDPSPSSSAAESSAFNDDRGAGIGFTGAAPAVGNVDEAAGVADEVDDVVDDVDAVDVNAPP